MLTHVNSRILPEQRRENPAFQRVSQILKEKKKIKEKIQKERVKKNKHKTPQSKKIKKKPVRFTALTAKYSAWQLQEKYNSVYLYMLSPLEEESVLQHLCSLLEAKQ